MNDLPWQSLLLFPKYPILSAVLLFLGITFILWMAHKQVEMLLRRFLIKLSHGFRLVARWLAQHANALHQRADELAEEYFMSTLEKRIDGEIIRLSSRVEKDLNGYPTINHKLTTLIDQYNEKYDEAQHVSVHNKLNVNHLNNKIDQALSNGDQALANLVKLRKDLKETHKRMHKEARKDASKRMKALHKLRSPARQLGKTLHKVNGLIESVKRSSDDTTAQIKKYKEMSNNRDMRLKAANNSVLTRFMIGIFFLLIITGGAFVNFLLIERPIAEMIGGGYVGNLSLPSIGALMVILIEMASGMMFAEALGLSHLIPNVAHWSPEIRKKVAIACGILLLAMASVEAGLAFMREILIAADAETTALLTGQTSEAAAALGGSLPVLVQAGMGFVIPLVLAFAAIPLEILFHTFRIIMQRLLSYMMWIGSFWMRILGTMMHGTYAILVATYELIIFFWLVVASWVNRLLIRLDRARA